MDAEPEPTKQPLALETLFNVVVTFFFLYGELISCFLPPYSCMLKTLLSFLSIQTPEGYV